MLRAETLQAGGGGGGGGGGWWDDYDSEVYREVQKVFYARCAAYGVAVRQQSFLPPASINSESR